MAELQGSRDYRDWGLAQYLQAAEINAINTNTRATGNFKKPPTIPMITGPDPKTVTPLDGYVPEPDEPEQQKPDLLEAWAAFFAAGPNAG